MNPRQVSVNGVTHAESSRYVRETACGIQFTWRGEPSPRGHRRPRPPGSRTDQQVDCMSCIATSEAP